jgi:hypothetical protein
MEKRMRMRQKERGSKVDGEEMSKRETKGRRQNEERITKKGGRCR